MDYDVLANHTKVRINVEKQIEITGKKNVVI